MVSDAVLKVNTYTGERQRLLIGVPPIDAFQDVSFMN